MTLLLNALTLSAAALVAAGLLAWLAYAEAEMRGRRE